MEPNDKTQYVKMVVVKPFKVNCAECDRPLFDCIMTEKESEDQPDEVYCAECYSEQKDKIEEQENTLGQISDLVGSI